MALSSQGVIVWPSWPTLSIIIMSVTTDALLHNYESGEAYIRLFYFIIFVTPGELAVVANSLDVELGISTDVSELQIIQTFYLLQLLINP
jgi:hypothetical protein